MKKLLFFFSLITYATFCQTSKITKEIIQPFTKILFVSQSNISSYRYNGLTKEFKNYGYDIKFENLTAENISLDVDTVLYNKAIEKYKPEILFIITKKEDGKLFEFGHPSLLNSFDVWNYQTIDLRTKKTIYKAVFEHFEFKKILKKFENDGLIKRI